MKDLHRWLMRAAIGWYEDKAMRLSSSVAFYMLLSLAPTIELAISLAGLVRPSEPAYARMAEQLRKLVGVEAGSALEAIVLQTQDAEHSGWASLLAAVVLLFGASAAWSELQDAMNSVWHVVAKPGRRIFGVFRSRLLAAAIVLCVTVVLLVLLVLAAALAGLETRLSQLPGGPRLWQLLAFASSMVVATILFALCFRIIPDVKLRFRDVWSGALVSGVLFALGELVLGVYIASSFHSSPPGAAGAVVVLLVWIYYSAQILFYGAELTKAQALMRGTRIPPCEHAVYTSRP